jgi:hypothetical protein
MHPLARFFVSMMLTLTVIVSPAVAHAEEETADSTPAVTFAPNVVLVGSWVSDNPKFSPLPSKLTVISVNGTVVKVRYQIGDDQNLQISTRDATLRDDGVLTWGGNGTPLFLFTPQSDGTVLGDRLANDDHSTIVLTRVDNPSTADVELPSVGFIIGSGYRGIWEDTSGKFAPSVTILTILGISEDGNARVRYQWGPRYDEQLDATVTGRILTWQQTNTYTFVLQDDGSLQGERVGPDGRSISTLRIPAART